MQTGYAECAWRRGGAAASLVSPPWRASELRHQSRPALDQEAGHRLLWFRYRPTRARGDNWFHCPARSPAGLQRVPWRQDGELTARLADRGRVSGSNAAAAPGKWAEALPRFSSQPGWRTTSLAQAARSHFATAFGAGGQARTGIGQACCCSGDAPSDESDSRPGINNGIKRDAECGGHWLVSGLAGRERIAAAIACGPDPLGGGGSGDPPGPALQRNEAKAGRICSALGLVRRRIAWLSPGSAQS